MLQAPLLLLGQRTVSVGESGTLRLVHVSDAHYHPFATACEDVPRGAGPCTHRNTTQFLASVLHVERPDLVAFTGDVIDGDSSPPQLAMAQLYGVAGARPWAASLGNHDEESTLSRDEVLAYVTTLRGSLTEHGPVKGSPGNFYLDVVAAGAAAAGEAAMPAHVAAPDARRAVDGEKGAPELNASGRSEPSKEGEAAGGKLVVARLVFFDSRKDHVRQMISDAQLAWFVETVGSLPRVPTLAFYHIPLHEYEAERPRDCPRSR
ncbi:hypothetical protein EMIHUDRAFT_458108 [Emiliania huxleyi CCMP1516]|uniref:Calcineurin-like phosphoesterase domain-containing protein n=2 Tax=Emiliania huxleyi TaxID=2903 RepID=A0A0D3JGJ7_EMIH1|nr:hypothetical protein EMIHUDRAFT_458108 [Emiliania huxleyi CCMP1516]EOD22632.1 hypothetical protein EMIHUDRAFT_458108 [Emiliania huxleyi CCMP1516]|mmetsp:Transcript_2229/g.6607  ORF Transcript_2229/g.6607 Transcript_2229/m.6607 type:complete len:263 (+) Transcript_2229:122-910(+)|eukprot:XP_005775061.1 hypothetical protein EMIHUDRAFT_458108 [Emiliania huxleyi CCMP1516]